MSGARYHGGSSTRSRPVDHHRREDALGAALEEIIKPIVERQVREALAAMQPTREEYLSTAAAADLARVHPATIRAWIRAGRLTKHKAGRVVRVRRHEIERLLADDEKKPERAETPQERAARDFGG